MIGIRKVHPAGHGGNRTPAAFKHRWDYILHLSGSIRTGLCGKKYNQTLLIGGLVHGIGENQQVWVAQKISWMVGW